MDKVEELYNKKAIECMIKRAKKGEISPFIIGAWNDCTTRLPGMDLKEFAAYNSNYSPSKEGIGEKAQLELLKADHYPLIEGLPKNGKNRLSLQEANKVISIIRGKKTNISGTKSFDAISEDALKVILFVLKTVDIGKWSESIGGGHQKNVCDEIERLISVIGIDALSYNGKPVEIKVLIDGRSSAPIIAICKKLIKSGSIITIGSVVSL